MWKKQKCKSDEVLSMRYATAKDLYQKLGIIVPESLEHVEVTNQSPSNHSRSSSNSSTPQRENSLPPTSPPASASCCKPTWLRAFRLSAV